MGGSPNNEKEREREREREREKRKRERDIKCTCNSHVVHVLKISDKGHCVCQWEVTGS